MPDLDWDFAPVSEAPLPDPFAEPPPTPQSVVDAALCVGIISVSSNELMLKGKLNAAIKAGEKFTIKSAQDYAVALLELKGLAKLKKEIETSFKDSVDKSQAAKKAASEAYKSVCDHRDEYLTPVKNMIDTRKHQVESWDIQMAKIAQIEEAQRVAETNRLSQAAEQAMTQGNAELAIDLSTQAAVVAAAAPVTQSTKVDGVYTQTRWDYEVVDIGLVPREYVGISPTGHLNLRNKAITEHGLIPVPGIRFFSTTKAAVRA